MSTRLAAPGDAVVLSSPVEVILNAAITVLAGDELDIEAIRGWWRNQREELSPTQHTAELAEEMRTRIRLLDALAPTIDLLQRREGLSALFSLVPALQKAYHGASRAQRNGPRDVQDEDPS